MRNHAELTVRLVGGVVVPIAAKYELDNVLPYRELRVDEARLVRDAAERASRSVLSDSVLTE